MTAQFSMGNKMELLTGEVFVESKQESFKDIELSTWHEMMKS